MNILKSTFIQIIKRKESLIFLILFIAGLSFFGRLSGKMVLASYPIKLIPISPVIAITFIALCILFLINISFIKSRLTRTVVIFLLIIISLFYSIIFLGYIFNFSQEFQNIFIKNPEEYRNVIIRQMLLLSSFLFVFICIGVLSIGQNNSSKIKYLGGSASVVTFVLSSILIIGYLYDYRTVHVPIQITVCFLLFSLTLLRQFELQFWTFNLLTQNKVTRQLFKSFLPLVVFMVIIQGFLIKYVSNNLQNSSLTDETNLMFVFILAIVAVIVFSKTVGVQIQRTEKSLRESNHRFINLADNINGYLAYVNADTLKYEYINKLYVKTFGISLEKIIGSHIKDILGERNYKVILKYINKAKSGESISFEYEMDFASGKRWILVNCNPVFDSNGHVKSIAVLNYDITRRKQAEISLSEREIQYYNLANSGMALIWTSGTDKLCNYFNEPWLKFTGRTLEQEMGNGWIEGVDPDDIDNCLKTYLTAFDNRQGFEMEYRLRHVSGEYRWVLDVGTPNYNINGEFLGYIGHCLDINERMLVEMELIKAKDKAEEGERLKSAFLTNMSHEIRTPMNGILGFTELLKNPNLTVEEQQDFIKTIGISGERMLNTINSIVDISKIESGLTKLNIKESNINDQIDFVYKFFKPEVESKGIQFFFKNGLSTKEAIIKTDLEIIYAILTNLVRNAIKFTNEGSIEFGYEKKGEYLEFFVKDTGIGIPQKQHQMIFERFRQGSESFTRGYEGNGLGLSISKSYVEMLGGEIWVESEEGLGSTFYFTLPYNTVSDEKIEIINTISAEDEEVQLKKLKILIVEDDEISYLLLAKTLQKISCEAIRAKTGLEAVLACRKHPDLDLILMDIKMPDMNGLEATRQIRQFNKDVIIIVQTAYVLSIDREKALEAGCNDYISKPINMTLLIGLILKHFNK